MIRFSRNLLIFLSIGYILNLLGGELLLIKERILTKKHLYYSWQRMDDFYNEEDNIDLLFLGSSRCGYSFNPEVIDSLTKMNSFNLGSDAQTPVTSYYLLKEALKKHQPEIIIYEISLDVLYLEQIEGGGYIIDAMKTGSNKLSFFIDGFTFKEKLEILLPVYRHRNNIRFFYNLLFSDIDKKYHNNSQYIRKGFAELYDDFAATETYNFKVNRKLERNFEYIAKIDQLARERGSELLIVMLPYPPGTVIVNETEMCEYLNNMIGNKLNREFLNLYSDPRYNDTDYFGRGSHLNYKGAYKISCDISGVILE